MRRGYGLVSGSVEGNRGVDNYLLVGCPPKLELRQVQTLCRAALAGGLRVVAGCRWT